jgi:hypothetical protein
LPPVTVRNPAMYVKGETMDAEDVT